MVCCIAIHFSSFHMWDSKCYGNWHGSQWSCNRGVVVCGLVIYIHVCCFNDTAKSFSIVSGEIYYVRMTNNLCWDCNNGQQPFRILGNVTWKSDRQHSWGSMSWQHMNFIPETFNTECVLYILSQLLALFANWVVLFVLKKWHTPAGMGCGCPEGLMHFVLHSDGKWARFR